MSGEIDNRDPQKYIPLSQMGIYIVASLLEEQPLHGWGIHRSVLRLSKGTVQAATGSLYPALNKLTEHGILQAEPLLVKDQLNPRLRTYLYSLSEFGLTVVDAHQERQRMLLTAIDDALKGRQVLT